MSDFFEQASQIIGAASQSLLGIFALMILALAFLCCFLFKDAAAKIKVVIFGFLFFGVVLFGFTMFQVSVTTPTVTDQGSSPVDEVLPVRLDSIFQDDKHTWTNRIFAMQSPNGGVKSAALDPNAKADAWTTAQCLKAVLVAGKDLSQYAQRIKSAFNYIEEVRHIEPREGWGYFENHDRTVTHIATWVVLAYIESIKSGAVWTVSELPEITVRVERDLDHIAARQTDSGGWSPIDEVVPHYTRTYPTLMALWSLIEARKMQILHERIGDHYDQQIKNGILWLLSHYNDDVGWVPNPNRRGQNEVYPGLTAQVLFVLYRAQEDFSYLAADAIYAKAKADFSRKEKLLDRPLALNERVSDLDQYFHPTDFQAQGSTFLWWPWAFITWTYLSVDILLSESDGKAAQRLQSRASRRADEIRSQLAGASGMYEVGEYLFCTSFAIEVQNSATED